jgi:hypothetical protein
MSRIIYLKRPTSGTNFRSIASPLGIGTDNARKNPNG